MILSFSLLFLLSCSHKIEKAPSVGTYVSSERGFSTSSYWIEGPEGVVVIDVQFLLSASEELLKRAESETGKKVVMAIVLHPNPDKFNGTEVFQKRGIRVITSKAVASFIPEVFTLRKEWFFERFKPDFPAQLPEPEIVSSIPQTGVTELKVAGLNLKLHGMGKGCSYAHMAVEWNGHLFTGDLVTNGYHSWLELGFVNEWIQRISEFQKLKSHAVHPGRGPSGGYELLDHQLKYLNDVKKFAQISKNPKEMGDKILEAYPDLAFWKFVRLGQEETFKNLSSRK